MGQGFAYSIYFMLTMVFFVLPGLVGFAFWHSNRQNRDGSYQPPPGQRRWTGDGQVSETLSEKPAGGE